VKETLTNSLHMMNDENKSELFFYPANSET